MSEFRSLNMRWQPVMLQDVMKSNCDALAVPPGGGLIARYYPVRSGVPAAPRRHSRAWLLWRYFFLNTIFT